MGKCMFILEELIITIDRGEIPTVVENAAGIKLDFVQCDHEDPGHLE